MTDKFVTDEIVGEDGKLVLQLPADAPRGHIRVTVEAIREDSAPQLTPDAEAALDAQIQALLSDENLRGQGLTAEEIARAPEIGIWKDRTDITDSVEFVEEMRRKNLRERLNRD
jgi:hypothetical protein